MILTCTECDTSFNFDDRLIKPSGSKVRCSKCHSVFVAYPQSASAPAAASAGGAATGLDDVDLDAIEKDLDLDIESATEELGGEVVDSDELDFDLGLEDDVAPSPASGDTQFQETQELDLSDFDLDEATDTADIGTGTEDELTFDLDLDQDDLSGGADEDLASAATEADEAPDLDFDLGLDIGADEAGSGAAAAADESAGAATDDDLDFSLDLDADEAPAAAQAAVPDDDLMDETRAMDLGELDDLLSAADQPQEEPQPAAEADALDIELDLDADAALEPSEEDSTEELDFDLGLDGEEKAEPVLEETEELDLADLEGMIEGDEDAGAPAGEEPSAGDFELDLDMAETAEAGTGDAGMPMEETEELDLTGLEDALELDESPAASADEDIELDLDFNAVGGEPAVAEELEEDEDAEFDLTDLDDMLEMDEGDQQAPAASAGEDDFDLELDIEAEADDAGIDHEFDVEDEGEQMAAAAAVDTEARQQGGEMADTFDMGTIAGLEEDAEGGAYLDDDEAEYTARKPPKKAGRGIGRPIKMLLVLFLLVGGGYGAVTLLNFFGIQVPYLDVVREIEIPYVSSLLGPKDAGNLKIAILENQLSGKFVENAAMGPMYVVRGKVRNNYKHSRSYINLTGKLYAKGGALKQTKTVYAGNMIPDQQLAGVNSVQLSRRENNRNGNKGSNVNVGKGKVVPFMIVFTNLPPNLDEYSVEVAGSQKAQ